MTDTSPDMVVPAATLVIFREQGDGPPELLMVERGRTMAFAAGAMVFPGGRVDEGDRRLAAAMDRTDDATVGMIAAIRETIEECGLPLGLSTPPTPKALERMRAALNGAVPIGTALGEAGCTLDLAALVPFARWRPAHRHARLFDTRFFLARLPAGAPPARVDMTENVRLVWTTAQGMLDAADAGHATIIFPTRRNLERLAQFAGFDAAAAQARAMPDRVVTPWIETRDGEEYLCIPDDLGYPVTAERMTGALRG